MSKGLRQTPARQTEAGSSPATPPDSPRLRALVVSSDAPLAAQLAALIKRNGVEVVREPGAAEASDVLASAAFDLLIVDGDAAPEEARSLLLQAASRPGVRSLLVTSIRDAGALVAAVRAGVTDFIDRPLGPDAERSLRRAVELARRDRRREERVERLRRLCRKLHEDRADISGQVDSLCEDLVAAYQELADQIGHVTAVTEFAATIRQELDVEELLRTTLEFLLRKHGPMNAAVYLPNGGDDFTLGAYVNFDGPAEHGDAILEGLADRIVARMAEEGRVLEYRRPPEIAEFLNDDHEWFTGSRMVAFSARHEDECLAIFLLFRSADTPFEERFTEVLASFAAVFARQLAHVIRIHHRHLPDDWHGFGGDDDLGLAA